MNELRDFFAYPLEGVAISLLWVNSLLFKYEYEVAKFDTDEPNKDINHNK